MSNPYMAFDVKRANTPCPDLLAFLTRLPESRVGYDPSKRANARRFTGGGEKTQDRSCFRIARLLQLAVAPPSLMGRGEAGSDTVDVADLTAPSDAEIETPARTEEDPTYEAPAADKVEFLVRVVDENGQPAIDVITMPSTKRGRQRAGAAAYGDTDGIERFVHGSNR